MEKRSSKRFKLRESSACCQNHSNLKTYWCCLKDEGTPILDCRVSTFSVAPKSHTSFNRGASKSKRGYRFSHSVFVFLICVFFCKSFCNDGTKKRRRECQSFGNYLVFHIFSNEIASSHALQRGQSLDTGAVAQNAHKNRLQQFD